MKTIQSYVNETLFDGKDKVKGAEAQAQLDMFYKYASGTTGQPITEDPNFDIEVRSDGLYITQKHAYACLQISGINDRFLPEFQIKYFDGRLDIEKNNITSLEGIFAPDCVFKGVLMIVRNKNLQSLEGCPERIYKSDNNPRLGPGLTVSENDNLSSFNGFPAGIGLRDLWWNDNAKIDIQDPTFKRLLKKHIKK